MLNKITLQNFRKHVDSTFEFGTGLHVIRGGNEFGKSTALEAIAYALFGVKALRSPLSETVTWGQAEGSLKVVLNLTVDGVDYTITRQKSGCECTYAGGIVTGQTGATYSGGIVTGQTEVTNFMGRLLKVDAVSASKLMLSTQLDIRGALEAGPKATTELIERLAEFDQIDNLIELMQEKLTLGNSATALANVANAQTRLDAALATPEPDLKALVAEVERCDAAVAVGQEELDSATADHLAKSNTHAKLKAHASEWASLTERGGELVIRMNTAERELKELREAPVPEPVNADEQIQALLEEKAQTASNATRCTAYEKVKPHLNKTPDVRFPGDIKAVQAALSDTQALLDEARDAIRKGDIMTASLTEKLHGGSCTFCGKDFSDLPEVQAKNREVTSTIDSVAKELEHLQADVLEHTKRIQYLKLMQEYGHPLLQLVQKYGQYLEVDETFFPPTLSWKGAVPVHSDVEPDYDADIRRIRAQVSDYAMYLRKITKFEEELDSANRALEPIKLRCKEIGAPENDSKSAQAVNDAAQRVKEAKETLTSLRSTLSCASAAQKDAQNQWAWAQREILLARATLESAKAEAASLEFNNALLKKVRQARPAIADKLWSLVLSAVSSYFSELRGKRSKVTKTSDGFLVDGHPVASLSGSTLDILGLAIRVALVRTFLPAAPFLVLDEPMAGCDTARTEAMLGFLASAGFHQILLVTHEDVSESVADHVIALGD